MNWPLPQDFNEAVQNPTTAFTDPDLKSGQAIVGPQGLPLPRSGNFADVYQIRAADGRDWAVKCFTRPVTGLEQRYAKVDAALERADLPFTIGFTFLGEGVRAGGQWLPAVKMEWVDGLQLNQVVRDQAGNPKVLDALCQMWARLCKRLREAGIAHADLQHGNVLLVPGSRPGTYGLRLIDYDGMYIPALANQPSGEAGHPNYQHPTRATKHVYSPDLDRFPHLVIATALKGLAVLGPGLWERYDTGDNLLFTEEDFRTPAASRLMRELWRANDPGLQALVGHLAVACGRPIPQAPWLDQVAPDGVPVPLTPDQWQAAAVALGFAAPPVEVEVEVVRPAPPRGFGAPPPAPPVTPSLDLPEFEVEREAGPRRRKPQAQASMSPVLIVGGVFLLLSALAGAVVAGIYFLSGKKPDEVVQVHPKPEDPPEKETKPKEKPKPVEKEKEPVDVGPRPPGTPIVPPQPSGPTGPVNVASLPQLAVAWEKPTGVVGGINRMAVTADGKYLAAAGYGRKDIRVLDAKTGTATGRFAEHESPVLGLAPLPGGEIASLGADQGFALVWDPKTGRGKSKILCPELPERKPEPFVYTSPDGRYLLSGGTESDNGRAADVPPPPIEVTETETGKTVVSFRMSWGAARFTTDSTRLVVADDRTGLLRVFRLPAGQLESEAKVGNGEEAGLAVAVSPTGRHAVFLGKPDQTGGRPFHVYELQTGKLVRTISIPNAAGFRSGFSPDGKWLRVVQIAPAAGGTQVVLVDTATWTPTAVAVSGNTQGIQWDHGPQFSPDGKLLFVPKAGGQVVAFDLSRSGPAVAQPKPVDPEPEPVAGQPFKKQWAKAFPDSTLVKAFFAPDGQSLFVSSGAGGRVEVLDAHTGTPGVSFQGHGAQSHITYVWGAAGQGRVASLAFPELSPLLWDIKTGTPRGPLVKAQWVPPAPAGVFPGSAYFTVSSDGRYVFVGHRGKNKPPVAGQQQQFDPAPFRLIDTTTGKEVVAGDWEYGDVRFTADSTRALIYESNGRFRWITLPAGGADTEWKLPPCGILNPIRGLSADGASILYFGPVPDKGGAQVHLLDGKTGKIQQSFPSHALGHFSRLSPDGRVVGGVGVEVRNGLLRVRVGLTEVGTGAVLANMLLNTDPNQMPHFEFAPDGRSFVLYDRSRNELALYELAGGLVAVGPKPKDPEPKPVDPEPKPKDPDPKPKDPEPKPKGPEPKPAPPPVDRKPVPDDAALAQAQTQVREKLKDDYARRSNAEKKALVAKLIGLAEKQADDPAGRYVMLRDARDMAVEQADPVLAAQAVDGLGRWFEVETGRLKNTALEKIRDVSTSSAALRAIAEVALAGADAAMAAEEYDAAAKLARTAADAARQGNLSAAVVDEAEGVITLARKAGAAFDEVKLAVARLKANPDDTDAALTVGKYRCFTQGRWDEGVKLLAKGNGPILKAVAELDVNTPPEPGPAAKTADAWWDFAQTAADAEKRAAEARARRWYTLALPKLTGEQKTQAETRLRFSHNGTDYRQGLIAEFTAKVPSVLQGKKARVDPVVTFSGGEFSDTGVGRATDISAKWTGMLIPPRAGRYRLVADVTDPVRIRVDGKVVIDTIASKSGKREGTIGLPDRPCPITIEFPCINTDRHHLRLCWTHAASPVEDLIPPEVLFHDPKAESVLGK